MGKDLVISTDDRVEVGKQRQEHILPCADAKRKAIEWELETQG